MSHKKGLKKVMSLVLAMMLVLGIGTTALADDPPAAAKYHITVPAGDVHTYKVYQIFKGDYVAEKDANNEIREYLSNVVWGQNGKTDSDQNDNAVPETVLKELEDAEGNDRALLDVIVKYVDFSRTEYAEIEGNESTAVTISVDPGYYLIKDASIDDGDAHTLYIVRVVGPVTIFRKAGEPEVEKKVQENSNNSWGGYADWNIGDDVPFALIGTLPDNYDMYNTYNYIFHDTLSSGLIYNNDFKVYVVDAANVDSLTGAAEITDKFSYAPETLADGNNGTGLKFFCTDLKKAVVTYSEGTRIVVRYTARLNENAVIGNPGNPNKVYLEYSNNPNVGGGGDIGKTPEKEVVVFTFELDGNKVDGKDADKKLEGAEFKLYRELTVGTKEYVKVDTDGKVTGWTPIKGDGSVLISAATGLFIISGLDQGTYYLEETKAPDGYNLLDDVVTLTVTAGYTTSNADGTKITSLTGSVLVGTAGGQNQPTDVTETSDNGSLTGRLRFNVENNKGFILTETGGIGTTIFYILGGILVLGCSVILVVRKYIEKR